MGSCCWVGMEFQFGKMKKFWWWMVVMLTQHCRCGLAPPELKTVWDGKFYLYISNQIKKQQPTDTLVYKGPVSIFGTQHLTAQNHLLHTNSDLLQNSISIWMIHTACNIASQLSRNSSLLLPSSSVLPDSVSYSSLPDYSKSGNLCASKNTN